MCVDALSARHKSLSMISNKNNSLVWLMSLRLNFMTLKHTKLKNSSQNKLRLKNKNKKIKKIKKESFWLV